MKSTPTCSSPRPAGCPTTRSPRLWLASEPSDLSRDEAVAYDVAAALVSGGLLPELTWRQAVALFTEAGTAELINLIGLYCAVCVTLNGFDVPVPDDVRG